MQSLRIMKTRNLLIALGLAVAGCHHGDDHATTAAPQPDFQANKPKAMASRIPASDGHRWLEPSGWVFFDSDSETLSQAAQEDLDTAVQWYRDHPNASLVLEGHADVSGPADHNLQLSFRRGISVADYLAAHGVPRDHIAINPEGERNATVPVRAGDRRVIIYATTVKK
jgi:outer membrane protein OmpA-like peptidoglycan-associated protein